MSSATLSAILMAGITLISVIACTMYLYYFRLWFRAHSAGVPISFARLFRMTARGIEAFKVVLPYVRAHEAGLDLSLDELESRHRAGENLRRTVQTMIDSKNEGHRLNIEEAVRPDTHDSHESVRRANS